MNWKGLLKKQYKPKAHIKNPQGTYNELDSRENPSDVKNRERHIKRQLEPLTRNGMLDTALTNPDGSPKTIKQYIGELKTEKGFPTAFDGHPLDPAFWAMVSGLDPENLNMTVKEFNESMS